MTALSDASAETGMMAHLKAMTGGVKIVWPNTAPYQPVNGTPYYRVSFLSVPSVRLGFGKADEHTGIFQVDAVSPGKGGVIPALAMARAVQSHFDRQNITENGIKVQIIKAPTLGPHMQDADWYTIPVSITYTIMN